MWHLSATTQPWVTIILSFQPFIVFGKACLPNYEDLPEDAKAKYNNIVAGLGVNDVGQAFSDILNSW